MFTTNAVSLTINTTKREKKYCTHRHAQALLQANKRMCLSYKQTEGTQNSHLLFMQLDSTQSHEWPRLFFCCFAWARCMWVTERHVKMSQCYMYVQFEIRAAKTFMLLFLIQYRTKFILEKLCYWCNINAFVFYFFGDESNWKICAIIQQYL